MNKAIVVGSFDPLTNGHEWIINEAYKLFDQIHVAVASNPDKGNMYSVAARKQMLVKLFEHSAKIVVAHIDNKEMTANYAKKHDIRFIVRGIRNSMDFEYERSLAWANYGINPYLQHIYMITPPELSHISSSAVRQLIKLDGGMAIIPRYIPGIIYNAIMDGV